MSETTRNLGVRSMRRGSHALRGIHFDPNDDAAAAAATAKAAEEAAAAEAAKNKTFTQAELDKIVQDRVARVKADPPADYEALKTAAAELETIKAASLSELEKANAARDKATADGAKAIETANARLIQAEVLAAATAANALRPEHLHKLIDAADVKVGDDGQVTGAAEAVKAFLEANPEYVGGKASGDADQGARKGGADQLTREALKTMSAEEITKATAAGRFEHLLKGG